MPKKTKKQKLLAEIHRRNLKEKGLTYNFVKPPSSAIVKNVSNEVSEKTRKIDFIVTKPQTLESTTEYDYLKQDLLKIFLYTIFALISQGVLYYLVYRPWG